MNDLHFDAFSTSSTDIVRPIALRDGAFFSSMSHEAGPSILGGLSTDNAPGGNRSGSAFIDLAEPAANLTFPA